MTTGEFVFEWVIPAASSGNGKVSPFDSASTANPPVSGHAAITSRETEIFVPSSITTGRKLVVEGLATDDKYHYDIDRQTLYIVTKYMVPGKKCKVKVSLNPPLTPMFAVNDLGSDFGAQIMTFSVVIIAILAYFFTIWFNSYSI